MSGWPATVGAASRIRCSGPNAEGWICEAHPLPRLSTRKPEGGIYGNGSRSGSSDCFVGGGVHHHRTGGGSRVAGHVLLPRRGRLRRAEARRKGGSGPALREPSRARLTHYNKVIVDSPKEQEALVALFQKSL